MDKIPRKTMGVGLLILIAVLGYIYSLQTSMLLITLIGFFLITFVYMYVCYASAVYVPEIWPTEAKLRGSGLANAVGRISGIAAPLCGGGITQRLWRDGRFRPAGRCLDYRRRRNSDYRNRDQGCFGQKSGH
ncbi:major facilitator family transporter [Salmonella enterica subsp. enterica serovar Choleraesuis str. 0006]|nr:major facilitator family transporter [Salmonella enterica subsp. enterica serovar Choleraesuis str. 0006]